MATVMSHEAVRGNLAVTNDEMEISSDVEHGDMDDQIDIDFNVADDGNRQTEDQAMVEYDGLDNALGTDDVMNEGSEIGFDEDAGQMLDDTAVQDEDITDVPVEQTQFVAEPDDDIKIPGEDIGLVQEDRGLADPLATTHIQTVEPTNPDLITFAPGEAQTLNDKASAENSLINLPTAQQETLIPTENHNLNVAETASVEDEITYSEHGEDEQPQATVQGNVVETFEDEAQVGSNSQVGTELPRVAEEPHYTAEEVAANLRSGPAVEVLPHPIVLAWGDEEYSLFAPKHNEADGGHLLLDNSLANGPLGNLVSAIRKALGNDITEDQEIHLQVSDLGLTICEDVDYSSSNPTMSHLLEIYLTLCQNESADEPEPLYVNLFLNNGFRSRLNQLYQAIDEQKPLSQTFVNNNQQAYQANEGNYGQHNGDAEDANERNGGESSSSAEQDTEEPIGREADEEEEEEDDEFDESGENGDEYQDSNENDNEEVAQLGGDLEEAADEYADEEENDDYSAEQQEVETFLTEGDPNDRDSDDFVVAQQKEAYDFDQELNNANDIEGIDFGQLAEPNTMGDDQAIGVDDFDQYEIDFASQKDEGSQLGEDDEANADVEQEIENFFPEDEGEEAQTTQPPTGGDDGDLFDEITYDDDEDTAGDKGPTLAAAAAPPTQPTSKKRALEEEVDKSIDSAIEDTGPDTKKARSS